ncbi:S9 family peptidase [Acidiluteibacter ferrifornacis]|uniref:Prolyl oligopeptidase family serine peptidase n=1 Tax=Acidiluteibacter ferrifornacis TaxID=2692424 RepID=A0A6N9NJU1_9FLAO|nr:prolyl oligopeptidase family serine peptidase [Acidiluteibacter ferrifornacis]NBG66193.1 prolyl oligopeptidase family serine peptidase [Acidiluteibacter ferrifornacis]
MKKIILTSMALMLICSIHAQTDESKMKGDPKLVSTPEELGALAAKETGKYKYSVADYFKKPNQSSFQFSPDGKYVSYKQREENGKVHVYTKNTITDEVVRVIEEKDELIRGYGWANETRLIYIMDKGGDENYHLFAVDIDGKNQVELTPYEGVKVDILNALKEQKDFMIILMNKDNPQVFEPYKINIKTAAIEKLYTNDDPLNPISGYDFDKDGVLKGFTKQQNGTEYVLNYRLDENQPFEPILTTTWKDDFYIINFDYTTENKNDAFVMTNLESNTREIVLYDFKEKKVIKKVYSNPTFDVSGMSVSRKRNFEVDYFYYNGEKYHIEPVSETAKKLNDKFKKQFGNKDFYISSKTDEEDKYLIYVTSDKLYGKYYTYDVSKDAFKEVLNLMPQLKEEDMAEMRSIKFTSRDGLTIYGYLTIPNAVKNGTKVPMIVNPHGGPYGPRDDWGYNPETQLFASRGYATLQVNYRGSGGYGKEFYLAGNKQIGRKMLDDLEDAVAYVKTLGLVDEDKIGIYGGSYGGLATLGSLVKTPDLYTCGVDYVGVSNLFTFFKAFPPYWKPYLGQVYEQWYDENDEDDIAIMKQVSPALNVEKITKPLFVVQGANDPRVNIDESDQVVKNMRARGINTPYMVKYDEGHGFAREENRIDLYQTMMGFFAVHLK